MGSPSGETCSPGSAGEGARTRGVAFLGERGAVDRQACGLLRLNYPGLPARALAGVWLSMASEEGAIDMAGAIVAWAAIVGPRGEALAAVKASGTLHFVWLDEIAADAAKGRPGHRRGLARVAWLYVMEYLLARPTSSGRVYLQVESSRTTTVAMYEAHGFAGVATAGHSMPDGTVVRADTGRGFVLMCADMRTMVRRLRERLGDLGLAHGEVLAARASDLSGVLPPLSPGDVERFAAPLVRVQRQVKASAARFDGPPVAVPDSEPRVEGAFYEYVIDCSTLPFGADIPSGWELRRIVRCEGGMWRRHLLALVSAVMRRARLPCGDGFVRPGPGYGLYADRRMQGPREAGHQTRRFEIGRYSGASRGHFASPTCAAAVERYQGLVDAGGDRLLFVQCSGGGFDLIDATEGEAAPFLSLANDIEFTNLQEPKAVIKPSGVMYAERDIPAFRWGAATVDDNVQSEITWRYGDLYWQCWAPRIADLAAAALPSGADASSDGEQPRAQPGDAGGAGGDVGAVPPGLPTGGSGSVSPVSYASEDSDTVTIQAVLNVVRARQRLWREHRAQVAADAEAAEAAVLVAAGDAAAVAAGAGITARPPGPQQPRDELSLPASSAGGGASSPPRSPPPPPPRSASPADSFYFDSAPEDELEAELEGLQAPYPPEVATPGASAAVAAPPSAPQPAGGKLLAPREGASLADRQADADRVVATLPTAAVANETQALDLPRLIGSTSPPPPPPRESLLTWNAARWRCAPLLSMDSGAVAAAQRRYDFIASILQGADPPAYLALSEIDGSLREWTAEDSLQAWLAERGYDAAFVPGLSPASSVWQPPTGGAVLAWRRADVAVVTQPVPDPQAVVLAGTFRWRASPASDPPTVVGAVYGRHRRGGRLAAVRVVSMRADGRTGLIVAGDFNVTPCASYQLPSRRRDCADDEFGALVGGSEGSDVSPAALVRLGHNHAGGEFTHVDRKHPLPGGGFAGSATIDHVVVAGAEREAWALSSRFFAVDADGLVSDHECIWVVRAPRSVASDGAGEFRASNFRAASWTTVQRQVFFGTARRELGLLMSGHRTARRSSDSAEGARATLEGGTAAAVDELVAILVEAAQAAVAASCRTRERCVLSRGRAGGGLEGLRQQELRVSGIIRKLQRASDAWAAAIARVRVARQALPRGGRGSAPEVAAAAAAAAGAAAAVRSLLFSSHPDYVGRHDNGLHEGLRRRRGEPVSQMMVFALSHLRSQKSYYASAWEAQRRADDAVVWRGFEEARAARDPSARLRAVMRVICSPRGGAGTAVRGFYRGDDSLLGEWVEDPATMRADVGDVFRMLDDENLNGDSVPERVAGFHAAFVPRHTVPLDAGGRPWALSHSVSFDDFMHVYTTVLRKGKATSLDRVSKELVEYAPPELQYALYTALIAVGTPDVDGLREQPAVWQHVPVMLIDKKSRSDEIKAKRDIGLPSQLLKGQGALYLPAYEAIMPRLLGNFGWTRGVAMSGAAQLGGATLDHALLLKLLLIGIYGDLRRFFPSMNRGYVLLAEQWYGLSEDVRVGTARLYEDAVMRYETCHGMADFNFSKLRFRGGEIQGSLLSTEKAKIFLNSLSEALSMLVDGARLWNGTDHGRRVDTALCADDLLGTVNSWAAARVYVATLGEFAAVSRCRFGIDGFKKTVVCALTHGASGEPINAQPPPDVHLAIDGVPLPFMPISAVYAHIGDRRRFDGQQTEAKAQVGKLLRAWLARVRRVRKMNRREFAELTNVGFSSIIGPYAARTPLTFEDGEELGEKPRRQLYRQLFRTPAAPSNADRYLPATWRRPPQFGRVTEELAVARMAGDGWWHCSALAASALHDEITTSLCHGFDNNLRYAMRALLDLTCYMWGMRADTPATWRWEHLEHVLARRSGWNRSTRGDHVFPMEMFILHQIQM